MIGSKSALFVIFAAFSLLGQVNAKRIVQSEEVAQVVQTDEDATQVADEDGIMETNITNEDGDQTDDEDAWKLGWPRKKNKNGYKGKKYETEGAKWDPDGVPLALEDSNVANMDSDEAKAVRHKAAKGEPAWKGVGKSKKPGIWIWRIEQMKVKAWPKKKYGQFHKGDSYIVLEVKKKEGSEALKRNIFFWLGAESTTDEKGTAAYKTVELDDFFNGEPTQNREVQDHESQAFRDLFPSLRYLEGGVVTGFNPKSPVEYRKTLIIVRKLSKGEECPAGGDVNKMNAASYCLMEMPTVAASLNQGDCFLHIGKDVSYWCGSEASPHERNAATQLAGQFKDERPDHSRTQVNQVQDDGEFCTLLGDTTCNIQGSVDALAELPDPVFGEGVLFQLTDNNSGGDMYKGQMKLDLKEVGRGELTKSMLIPDDVMMLDTDSEIFVWIGRGASEIERRNGLRTAMTYLDNNGKSKDTAIHVLKDQEGEEITNEVWNKVFDN
jgi:gelsolin